MFFITYVRRELRRQMRQAIFIALGLALGVGLVVTVAAASAGVKKAQSDVLSALYGVGTDVTVTGAAPGPPRTGSAPSQNSQSIQGGPGGAEICTERKCENAAGMTIDHVVPQYGADQRVEGGRGGEAARGDGRGRRAHAHGHVDHVPEELRRGGRQRPPQPRQLQHRRRGHRAHLARPAEFRNDYLRPLLHLGRLRRRRRGGGLRVREDQPPEGRLDRHHRQGQVHDHRDRQPAPGQQPARRLHPPRARSGHRHRQPGAGASRTT